MYILELKIVNDIILLNSSLSPFEGFQEGGGGEGGGTFHLFCLFVCFFLVNDIFF